MAVWTRHKPRKQFDGHGIIVQMLNAFVWMIKFVFHKEGSPLITPSNPTFIPPLLLSPPAQMKGRDFGYQCWAGGVCKVMSNDDYWINVFCVARLEHNTRRQLNFFYRTSSFPGNWIQEFFLIFGFPSLSEALESVIKNGRILVWKLIDSCTVPLPRPVDEPHPPGIW